MRLNGTGRQASAIEPVLCCMQVMHCYTALRVQIISPLSLSAVDLRDERETDPVHLTIKSFFMTQTHRHIITLRECT